MNDSTKGPKGPKGPDEAPFGFSHPSDYVRRPHESRVVEGEPDPEHQPAPEPADAPEVAPEPESATEPKPDGADAPQAKPDGFTLEGMADELTRTPIEDRLKELGRKAKTAARYARVKDWSEDEVEAILLPIVVTEACSATNAHRAFAKGWTDGLLDQVEPKKKRERKPPPAGMLVSEQDVARAFQATDEGADWTFIRDTGEWREWSAADGWQRPVGSLLDRLLDFSQPRLHRPNGEPDPVRGGSVRFGEAVAKRYGSLPGMSSYRDEWDAGSDVAYVSDRHGPSVLRLGGEKVVREPMAREHRYMHRIACTPSWQGRKLCDGFLHRFLPDEAEREYVLLKLASALAGRQDHRALMLVGPEATGKSTLAEWIVHAFGTYAGSIETEVLYRMGNRQATGFVVASAVAGCAGKRVVLVNDPGETAVMDDDQWKKFTGNDTLKARVGNVRFDVKRTWLVLVTSNTLPGSLSGPMRRRLGPVHMSVQVPAGERDAGFPARLKAATPALLAHLVQRVPDVLAMPEIKPPPTVADMVESTGRPRSSLDRFLSKATEAAEPTDWVRRSELFEAYESWCIRDKVEPAERIKSEPAFLKAMMTEHGYRIGQPRHRGQRVRVYYGLRWRPRQHPYRKGE